MNTEWSRRSFLAGVALASCKGGFSPSPPAGAPRPGDIRLPPGGSVPRRRLGRTGVEVSIVGLGGHNIGRPKDEQEGIRLVRMALDHGMSFHPMTPAARAALLARTAAPASNGKYEEYKTTTDFDSTAQNPHWLDTARL